MAITLNVVQNLFRRPFLCRCLCTKARRRVLRAGPLVDKILRVDHAGEIGADRIYAGQMAVLGQTKSGPIIKVESMGKVHTRITSYSLE